MRGRPIALFCLSFAVMLVAAPSALAKEGPSDHSKPVSTTIGTAGDAFGPSQSPAPSPAKHGPQAAQGVAQSVTATLVVLKQLDGSAVSIPVDSKTRVFVNGKPALLTDVEPGFVVTASWTGGSPAHELQTFASSTQVSNSAEIVQTVSPTAVVVSSGAGTVTIRVDPKTRVFVNGKPASLRDVRPGFTLVTSAGGQSTHKSASELHFLRPGN